MTDFNLQRPEAPRKTRKTIPHPKTGLPVEVEVSICPPADAAGAPHFRGDFVRLSHQKPVKGRFK